MSYYEESMMPQETFQIGQSSFYIEVRVAFGGGGYDVIIVRRNSGTTLGSPFRDFSKAKRIAQLLYPVLLPEYEAEEERQAALRAEFDQKLGERQRAQQAVAEQERTDRLAKITPETPRTEQAQCPECNHYDDLDQFEQPVYECSQCGGIQVGEDGNRCEQCNLFMAKTGDWACPSCLAPLEEEPDLVSGVDVDGVFLPERELREGEQR